MIKSTIDLTASEIFSRRRPFTIVDRLPITLIDKQRDFPWIKLDDDELSEVKYFPILTKRQRKWQTIVEQCDCCGVILTSIPWNRHYHLCSRCDKYLEQSYIKKEKLWYYPKEMIANEQKISLNW